MIPNSVRRMTVFGTIALSFVTGVYAAGEAQSAKTGAAWPKGHYAALDKLPDWGGIWTIVPGRRAVPTLKGRYLEEYEAWRKDSEANDGLQKRKTSNCTPPGMPYIMNVAQYPIEFMFTPGRVTVHHEAWQQWRVIFTDGREHPDIEPSFQGHSTGRWDGDTLVVETVNIKDTVPLMPGMHHSDKIRILERFSLDPKDADTLRVEITVEDPEALAKPYTNALSFTRSRDGDLIEFICAENDRNSVDGEGNTTFEH